jgi:hypothetical protein
MTRNVMEEVEKGYFANVISGRAHRKLRQAQLRLAGTKDGDTQRHGPK